MVTAPSLLLLPGGLLPGELADTWAGAALAEITHGPTGYPDLAPARVRLAPGESGGPRDHGPCPALLTVLEGRLRVTAGGQVVMAAPGDSVAVPPSLAYAVVAETGNVEFLVYVLPVPGA